MPFPAETAYPAESLYPGETEFSPGSRRRKPPNELDWEVETAEGTVFRLPADAVKPSNRPMGGSGGSQRGDGFATGGVTLNRQIFKDYPDLNLLDTWRAVGRQGEVAYEGRLSSMPRSNDPSQTVQVQLVGWMTYLKGRPVAPLIIDRRVDGWGEPSLRRKSELQLAGNRFAASPSTSSLGEGSPAAAIAFSFTDFDGVYSEIGEAVFYAGGEDIESILATVEHFAGAAEDTDWEGRVGLGTAGESFSALGADINNGNHPTEANAVEAGFKYALMQMRYTGGFTGTGNSLIAFCYPRVIGAHGLTRWGTAPEEGFTASDIIRHLIETYRPKIQWAGGDNTTVVTQAAWQDSPTTVYDAIQQLNNLTLWETNVWEYRKFYFEAADLTKYDWQIKTSDPGVRVNFQGDSIENFANGVVVTYTDFAGVVNVLYPTDHSELQDTNENNAATLHGEDLWTEKTVPWQCTEAEALQFGRAYLAEYNRPKRPGSFTIQGYIQDGAGHWQQYWKPRSSESIGIMDHPSESEPRLITAVSWDIETQTTTITVDAPPQTLDAIVARQEVALQARNLR